MNNVPAQNAAAETVPPASQKARGKLKIFFGAAAGVGKTFSMLQAAQALKREGIDVVVGAVETHGWGETAALLAGLETLPLKRVDYRGSFVQEFDLDAAIARKPQVILLDDLAHANAPNSRHDKRWQDVRELLDTGINVYATMNVQHLESLNHIIERVTGVDVRETVPDHVLEGAASIELVDRSPEELLKRLHAASGNVARAQDGVFSLNHLIALRELALRVAAERVHAQVQALRKAWVGAPMVPTTERLLVCIGPDALSSRLVRSARRMAASLQAEWIAVYVQTPGAAKLSEADRNHAIQNIRLAELLGAETVTLSGVDIASELISFARLRNVTRIIIGKPFTPRWREIIKGSLVHDLVRRSGDIDVYVINGDAAEQPHEKPSRQAWWTDSYGYAIAMGVIAAATLASVLLRTRVDQINIGMIYLLAVVVVAAMGKRGPAVFSALLGLVSFTYVFIPSHQLFTMQQVGSLIAFASILFVALLVSTLTVRLRQQVDAAFQREARTAALHAVSRDLATTRGIDNLLAAAAKHGAEVFAAPVAILLPDDGNKLQVRGGDLARCLPGSADLVAAQWAFDHARPAGIGTDTLKRVDALHVPLVASRGTVGVLSVFVAHPRQLNHPERRYLVEAFAHQVALAIECDHLAVRAQKSQFEVETERLRNALLSSVSHDLRTPLAAITGAASSLVEQDQRLNPNVRLDLAKTIAEESEQLARLVSNLLDMTRLEGGGLRLQPVPHVIEDMVGAAFTVMERRMQGRSLRTEIPPDLPPARADGILMQEVLVNLIDNALKYSPRDALIEVGASAEGGNVRISVRDRGPGLKPDEIERVFEKFYRGSAQGHTAGVGLGLSICKGIVEAHGGRIWAENRDGGGAVFNVELPAATMPAVPEPRKETA